jgi:signal transduction histidine kinase
MLFHDVTDNIVTERIRRDFIRNASHELRTPLSLILGYIETLKSGIVRGAQALDRSLDVMDKHGRRMARLIEDMLTLSRFEGDDPQFVRERFLVHSCVADVLEHLSPLIASRKALVSNHLPAHDGFIVGDRYYWDQIFTNLIENAVKGNSEPGLRVAISGKWADGQCSLIVRDNGVGIPPEDVPFVFKRFYRCARARAENGRGTGLGLSIVKRAVEAHGGTVSLTSTPGRCTSFIITVPVDRDGQ